MTILPLTYLGNTEWWAALLAGDAVIDLGEHYVKQSCRNRAEILTADGPMILTVNVVKGSSIRKRPVAAMQIDYSKRWQHQHWNALRSAYRSSPYFDHLSHLFEPLYKREVSSLREWNLLLIEAICTAMHISPNYRLSESYLSPSDGDRDLRNYPFLCNTQSPIYKSEPYYHVFPEAAAGGFQPRLSVLDLLFCEGPSECLSYLRRMAESR